MNIEARIYYNSWVEIAIIPKVVVTRMREYGERVTRVTRLWIGWLAAGIVITITRNENN